MASLNKASEVVRKLRYLAGALPRDSARRVTLFDAAEIIRDQHRLLRKAKETVGNLEMRLEILLHDE